MRCRLLPRGFALGLSVMFTSSTLTSCAAVAGAAPKCDEMRRLAVVAQSVETAAYVPCVSELRPGWDTGDFAARSGTTSFTLTSDRDSDHPVKVELHGSCDTSDATSTTPRADGARTYLRLVSIDPRYAGTLLDVFAGGCISYRFDFARGTHIALIDDFESMVGLLARRDLALALRRTYKIELGP